MYLSEDPNRTGCVIVNLLRDWQLWKPRTKCSPPRPWGPTSLSEIEGSWDLSGPTPAPGDTYKLGAFLSRHLRAAGRRRVLGILPARHLAFPPAAERGGGGIGDPGGGALSRVVQSRPVPIHISPQFWETGRRRPLCKPQTGAQGSSADSLPGSSAHATGSVQPNRCRRGRSQHIRKLPPPRTSRGLANPEPLRQ